MNICRRCRKIRWEDKNMICKETGDIINPKEENTNCGLYDGSVIIK